MPTSRLTPHSAPHRISPLNFLLYLRISGDWEKRGKKGKGTDEPVSYQERSSLTIFGPSCFTPPFSPGSCMLRRGPGSSKWSGLAEGDGRPGPLRVSGGK